ncbi:MAG TPA: hypothetical protein VND93_17215 [Myxococcales bacterium]|jgi:hypothetical protein|nr:hypothetical protein [Myxococcales bacterium]
MNVKVTWIARLAVAGFALAATSALAQASGSDFELERLQYNPSASGGLTVWDGTVMNAGSLRVGAAGQYEQAPLVLHRPDGFPFGILVKERATIHATFAFAVTKWLEIDGQVPWVFFSNGSSVAGLAVPRGKELGTPWLSARFPILHQGDLGGAFPVNLGGDVSLGFPAGPRDLYTNPHGAMLAPRLNASMAVGQIQAALELSMLFRPQASLETYSGSIYDRALNTWGAALMVSTTGTGARVEVTGRFARNFFAPGWGAELQAGLRLPVSPIGPELFVEAGPGAGNLIGQPAFRVYAGFAFGGSQKVLGGAETPAAVPAAGVESPTLPLPPPRAPAPGMKDAAPQEAPPPAPAPAPADSSATPPQQ